MFTSTKQAWEAAVVRNTVALRAIVAEILSVLAIYGGLDVAKVPRVVRNRILAVLRPAEAALRRLIVIAAYEVSVAPPQQNLKRPLAAAKQRASKTRALRMAFRLFDPRKRFTQRRINYTRFNPRVSFIAADPPFSPLVQQPAPAAIPVPETQTGARRLCLRVAALSAALDDVPRQAKRLARLQARRELRKSFISPLRPGKPPGHRKIPVDDVDLVLAECHDFATAVLAEPPALIPNTS
jgi:hypothetical protein